MNSLLAVLAVVAMATATKPDKYRMDDVSRLHDRDVHRRCDGPLQFLCGSGQCIQSQWLCDTEKDCSDSSDEVNCPTNCTGPNQYHCHDGTCVSSEFRCDGVNDCTDRSDEAGCDQVACDSGEDKCANSLCVEKYWFCDGSDDCGDGSDEANCPSTQTCHDLHPASVCGHLNQTSSPICLDYKRALVYCQSFCGLCP
ncbi:hypothetical protein ACOMHN_042842 [Nucella lapillus]